jgi:acetyl-CoA carboxylase biotin carboxyl carrier protein
MPLTDDDVREILRIIDESPLEELRIEANGLSLYVSKRPAADAGAFHDPGPAAPVPSTAPAPAPAPAHAPVPTAVTAGDEKTEDVAAGDGAVTIDAPLLGTFYSAEGPGQQPFVDVGSAVEPGTVVAIIEVMKMMNSVTAGVSGTVIEIVPANGQLVEFGQPLFKVQPE